MNPQFYQAQAGLGFDYAQAGLGFDQAQAGLGEISPATSGVVSVGLNAGAGYLVGRLIGYPLAGAIATGALGIVGLLGVAIYASYKK